MKQQHRTVQQVGLGVAAQVEFECKIDAKLKALYHILVRSDEFQALSTRI
jgi:hypothetical protein